MRRAGFARGTRLRFGMAMLALERVQPPEFHLRLKRGLDVVLSLVGLTLALRHLNPNVTYALCYGIAFAALQLVAWRVFNQPLSPWQVAGIAFVGVGVCLLNIGSRV